VSTISALQSARYANVANEIQGAMADLGKGPPDTKSANAKTLVQVTVILPTLIGLTFL